MNKAKYENGDLLKDKVTALEGIVMVVAYYATGCIHCGLQDQKVQKDGKVNDWVWLDQSSLKLVKKGAVKFDVSIKDPSGPMPTGPQM